MNEIRTLLLPVALVLGMATFAPPQALAAPVSKTAAATVALKPVSGKRSDFGVGAYAPNVSDEVHLRITTEGMLADTSTAAK